MKYVFTKEGNYLIIVGNKSYQTIKDQCNSFFKKKTGLSCHLTFSFKNISFYHYSSLFSFTDNEQKNTMKEMKAFQHHSGKK